MEKIFSLMLLSLVFSTSMLRADSGYQCTILSISPGSYNDVVTSGTYVCQTLNFEMSGGKFMGAMTCPQTQQDPDDQDEVDYRTVSTWSVGDQLSIVLGGSCDPDSDYGESTVTNLTKNQVVCTVVGSH